MTRIILYATLGSLLSALGHEWDTWQFWCVAGLFWASDLISRQAGYEGGVVAGMSAYINANAQQRSDLDKIVKENND